jgi:hypothetical protein
VRQSLQVLLPRLPREPVREGEEWSWHVAIDALPKEQGGASNVRGNIEFRARVVGAEPRGVVIGVDFESSAEGLIVTDDAQQRFTSKGQGTAQVVFAPDKQQVVESIATQEETISRSDHTVTTSHSMRLVAEEPAAE